jgi:hypothetical protein
MALLIPTPFLCVTGMVTADVLASDEEYKEVGLTFEYVMLTFGGDVGSVFWCLRNVVC